MRIPRVWVELPLTPQGRLTLPEPIAHHLLGVLRLRPGEPLTIACDRLIRIDFGAAGSVLNWAAEQQSHGHVVQFHNLHRLVAVFFNVIGVNEHAWVVPRKN